MPCGSPVYRSRIIRSDSSRWRGAGSHATSIGLWYQRRWAEYLTFIATALFLPLEFFELTRRVSALRLVALVINLAIVAYLVWAKRLFGVRGGVGAERAERERDTGWEALERSAPGSGQP